MACVATMENQSQPLLSKADLRSLNLNHFEMVEAMGLKIITWRSSSMAYQIS
jgi:hypothetical protein